MPGDHGPGGDMARNEPLPGGAGQTTDQLRLAELVAALSLALDLGLGQPMEHILRSCLIALRLGEHVGLDDSERAAVYYVALLAWVGCTADSHELAQLVGDDIAFRADTYDVGLAGFDAVRFMLSHAGTGRSPLRRARVMAALIVTGGRGIEEAIPSHCRVARALAEGLGLGPGVCAPLEQNFTRWDGKGVPAGVGARRSPGPCASSSSPRSSRPSTAAAA